MSETPSQQGYGLDRRKLIYRWDLDKTYLRTEFDSVRDLLRTAFEPAAKKRTVPGAAVLLREIQSTEPAGLYILSGSPEQMRRVLEAKLRLDGVRWDSFTLKPSLDNLIRGRFRFLRDQVGYKLAALLVSRSHVAADTDEICFGDDAEADAFIYSIFADLTAGRVQSTELMEVLERAQTYADDVPRMMRLAQELPRRDACKHIFIHLDRVSSPADFDALGHRVCPFYNYFQPALVLLEDHAIDAPQALRVGAELVVEHAFTPDALFASYADLARRNQLGRRAAELLTQARSVVVQQRYATATPVIHAFLDELEKKIDTFQDVPMQATHSIDYAEFFAKDKARARAAKRRVSR